MTANAKISKVTGTHFYSYSLIKHVYSTLNIMSLMFIYTLVTGTCSADNVAFELLHSVSSHLPAAAT